MSEITALTAQVKDKTRCNVFVDGRFCCGLTLDTVVKNRLKAGMQITQERLEEMQLESEKETAFQKALSFISVSQKTKKQVRDHLVKKGYLPSVIEYVLEKMDSYDFVNDADYAKSYAASALKKKGNRLIRLELKNKGISDQEIAEAFVEDSAQTELAAATAIAEKYLKNKTLDRENLQKAYRYLMGKGYDFETAKSAVSSVYGGELEDD
ncbi:MAG: RecX family transcriptional regulator [Clostridia bacterium]|nr:RecX family transcriptional regulator [Clostridia bacterium]